MNRLCTLRNVVWKPHNKKLLNIHELNINKGEKIALIGANGAGKTSLLRILCFLEKDYSGQLEYPGMEKLPTLEKRRKISTVFQNSNLLKGTVFENVALGLKLRGYSATETREKVAYWLEQFKISHLSERNARTLSRGEAQRVSLARAFITEPQFLLLDEPFSNLDVPTRSEILADLSLILKNSEITVIMITHYPAEIPLIAQRVLVMNDGELIEDGDPSQVLESPVRAVTAKLVGIDNVFEAKVSQGKADISGIGVLDTGCNFGDNDSPITDVYIKPDLISLNGNLEVNHFRFVIDRIVPMHDSYNLHGQNIPLSIRISRREYMNFDFKAGASVGINIPYEAIIVGRRADTC